MKNQILALVILIAGPLAHADDGGIVGIKVNEISAETNVQYDAKTDKMVGSPVASPDLQITINGKEANKLLQILPPILFVEATPQYPRFQRLFNANDRGLEIDGQDNQPKVTITCLGGDLDEGHPENPKFKKYPDGAHCTITIGMYGADDVEYTYNPEKNLCK